MTTTETTQDADVVALRALLEDTQAKLRAAHGEIVGLVQRVETLTANLEAITPPVDEDEGAA